MDDFWADDELSGPPLADERVRAAESSLGYRLPAAYVDLLRVQNGGTPRRQFCRAPGGPPPRYVRVARIGCIGGPWGIDATSADRIREWDYPAVGVVVADTPAAGHDVIMLDYGGCGADGEPRVIYHNTGTDGGA